MCFTLGELVKFASICLSLMSSEISLDLSKECQYQQNEQVFANTKTWLICIMFKKKYIFTFRMLSSNSNHYIFHDLRLSHFFSMRSPCAHRLFNCTPRFASFALTVHKTLIVRSAFIYRSLLFHSFSFETPKWKNRSSESQEI